MTISLSIDFSRATASVSHAAVEMAGEHLDGLVGRRVLVVGAGPAGLSAAYHLRRLGHQVVIFEAAEQPGGMMRYGIPSYRLPRDILDAEIARIAEKVGRLHDDARGRCIDL